MTPGMSLDVAFIIPLRLDNLSHQMAALADPRGPLGTYTPLSVQFVFILMQFAAKILPNNRFLRQTQGLVPSRPGNPRSATGYVSSLCGILNLFLRGHFIKNITKIYVSVTWTGVSIVCETKHSHHWLNHCCIHVRSCCYLSSKQNCHRLFNNTSGTCNLIIIIMM